MYERIGEFATYGPKGGKILSISHSTLLCGLFDMEQSEVIEANYPEFNILDLPFADDEFDLVVSDQVLEHVEGDPQIAIDETFRVVRPGGWVVHTTCLMNPIHGYSDGNDFWRFTPNGLKFLCRRFSRIIDADGWGNPFL